MRLFAFAALLLVACALGTYFGVRSWPPPLTPDQIAQSGQQNTPPQPSEKKGSSFFFDLGNWAERNEHAIGPLMAIGGLVAALALAYLTALLWGSTSRLADSTDRLAEAEHQQSAEMRKAYDLAEKQLLLAGRQCDVAEKQHGLQRTQFFAEYRPKLEIQFVRRIPERPGQTELVVEISIVNSGRSEATIIGSAIRLDWIKTSEIPSPHQLGGSDIIPHRQFLVGATDRATIRHPNTGAGEYFGGGPLYLFGWIVYVDGRGAEFGSTRTTYFLREYIPASEKFVAPKADAGIDPEWNTIQ